MDAAVGLPPRLKTGAIATAILWLAAATIVGVFAFQWAGYAPCELCLKERIPYYVAIGVAAATMPLAARGSRTLAVTGFALLALIFVISTGLGTYHAGVEWGWWPGPSDCTGALTRATSNAAFLEQLNTVRVIRCDAAAIRILGISLAGWDAVVSLICTILAAAGVRRALRS